MKKLICSTKLASVFFLVIATLLSTACATQYADKPPVKQFINEMVEKNNFNRQELVQLFNSVKPTISRPRTEGNKGGNKKPEKPEWYNYRPMFVTRRYAEAGARFWHQHAATLRYAERRYGVPAEIIVAIIGIESHYGAYTGRFRVIDGLSTFSFNYPSRAPYFSSELESFLFLSRENPIIEAGSTKGSFDGGIGVPQFMPSSYRLYAVDATGKGYSDLLNNPDDSILSVANYLNKKGWVRGAPVTTPARLVGKRYLDLPPQTNKPSLTLRQFLSYSVYSKRRLPLDLKATLITLKSSRSTTEYWLAFDNFYVIRRYNANPLYVMAAFQLGQLIHDCYQHQ